MTYDELADYCKEASNEIIRQDKQIRKLEKENERLKKQLEDTIEELECVRCDLHNRTSERDSAEEQNDLYKNQQQVFIKYLEDEIKDLEHSRYVSFNKYGGDKLMFYKDILQKYKEIIGVSND